MIALHCLSNINSLLLKIRSNYILWRYMLSVTAVPSLSFPLVFIILQSWKPQTNDFWILMWEESWDLLGINSSPGWTICKLLFQSVLILSDEFCLARVTYFCMIIVLTIPSVRLFRKPSCAVNSWRCGGVLQQHTWMCLSLYSSPLWPPSYRDFVLFKMREIVFLSLLYYYTTCWWPERIDVEFSG